MERWTLRESMKINTNLFRIYTIKRDKHISTTSTKDFKKGYRWILIQGQNGE